MEGILNNADTKKHFEIAIDIIRGTNKLLNKTMAHWVQNTSVINKVLCRPLKTQA